MRTQLNDCRTRSKLFSDGHPRTLLDETVDKGFGLQSQDVLGVSERIPCVDSPVVTSKQSCRNFGELGIGLPDARLRERRQERIDVEAGRAEGVLACLTGSTSHPEPPLLALATHRPCILLAPETSWYPQTCSEASVAMMVVSHRRVQSEKSPMSRPLKQLSSSRTLSRSGTQVV